MMKNKDRFDLRRLIYSNKGNHVDVLYDGVKIIELDIGKTPHDTVVEWLETDTFASRFHQYDYHPLKLLMAEKGITLNALSRRSMVNKTTIYSILKRKHRPMDYTIRQLADVLEVGYEEMREICL